jgi:hypothetical protein
MSFDGNGNYLVPANTQAVSGQIIESAKYNALLADLQLSLSKALLRDGQSAALANISMGGFKLTNSTGGSARTDLPTMGQVQDGTTQFLTTVVGVDTITANLTTPPLTAYVAGLEVNLTAVGDNTGAVTLNINGLGVKSVVTQSLAPLPADTFVTGGCYSLIYDGTRFQLQSTSAAGGGGGGAVLGGVIFENAAIATVSGSIASGSNGGTFGPLTLADGVEITVPDGTTWSIV